MKCDYNGFAIEPFEAGRDLWHARIRRGDLQPIMIDDVPFPVLEVGFAWSCPEAAIEDAKAQIEYLNRRGVTAGLALQPQRTAAIS